VEILVGESSSFVCCGNGVPTPLFLAIHPCLPATIFEQKFSSARNQMLFVDKYSAVSNNFFFNLLYSTSNIALPRYTVGRVSYKKMNEKEFGNWLTANFTFPAVTWKNIIWSFLMPLWCNKHLPGQSASIIIAFEFFWCRPIYFAYEVGSLIQTESFLLTFFLVCAMPLINCTLKLFQKEP